MTSILTFIVGAWFGYWLCAALSRSERRTRPVDPGVYRLNERGEIEMDPPPVVRLGQGDYTRDWHG